jgi:hypothetical protein
MALGSAVGERAVGDGGARGRDKHAAADARRRAPRQRKYCAELYVICGRLRNKAVTTNAAQVVHVH